MHSSTRTTQARARPRIGRSPPPCGTRPSPEARRLTPATPHLPTAARRRTSTPPSPPRCCDTASPPLRCRIAPRPTTPPPPPGGPPPARARTTDAISTRSGRPATPCDSPPCRLSRASSPTAKRTPITLLAITAPFRPRASTCTPRTSWRSSRRSSSNSTSSFARCRNSSRTFEPPAPPSRGPGDEVWGRGRESGIA